MTRYNLKQKLGCLLLDRPRCNPQRWLEVCNRRDHFKRHPELPGLWQEAQWSSAIHAARVFPTWGRTMFRAALAEWPVRFSETCPVHDQPQFSFIVGHRGQERKALLYATLQSLFAQRDITFECLVVEQSTETVLDDLPAGVRHLPFADDGPYNRGAVFNRGVHEARGSILVFHDNDLCVPERYGAELARIMDTHNYEVAQLYRFIFYLNPADSETALNHREIPDAVPERIVQNTHGGSIAITRDTCRTLGGHDERFAGWGGEDNEFYERCLTARHYFYGYLPLVHLWHDAQERKVDADQPANRLYQERSRIPVEQRIAELSQRNFP